MRARAEPGVTRQAILDFIRSYVAANGYPPTIRESMEAAGLTSPSTAHLHVLALERDGLVERRRVRGGDVAHSFAFFPVDTP